MKKIATLCISLMMTVAGMADTFVLSYQGFPYNRTKCAGPTYAAGTAVKLTTGIPEKKDSTFAGWSFYGTIYAPGAYFIMPAQDVELIPAWEEELAVEQIWEKVPRVSKFIRDGQVVILRDGMEYNVLGVRLN